METNFIYSLLGNNLLGYLAVCILPLVFLIVYALVAILGELKIGAFMQDRLGPMRTGPWGTIQPIAEVVKLLQKENITPDAASKFLFNLAPFIIFTAAFAAFAVIPFSPKFVPSGINLGLFYIFAIGSFAVIGIFMGGWASNNKYSLLGAVRSVAQIISYEIPAGMAILSIAALAGTLDMNEIITKQSGWFTNWYIFGGSGSALRILFLPFTFGIFVIYLIASLAETNRTPFDIPEGESEIVAGYHTEYSGMKFAMFFFAEYANMFVVSALLTIMFFGGWNSPFGDFMSGPIWAVVWFLGKSMSFIFLQIWLRWTLPRLRVDQLMYTGWKVLLPISFVCFFAIALLAMLK
ncbi:MAG: dehydrogenase (quinone) [Ignavibacteria bacterium]|nr:dehydrogenase (quinone) [Ignavibacteria bacterium]